MAFNGHGPFELPVLLQRADQALYRAKQDGRNCIAIAIPEMRATGSAESTPARVVTLNRRNAA
jgi:predicted signal transduction protein with EAL and GGDEF domain